MLSEHQSFEVLQVPSLTRERDQWHSQAAAYRKEQQKLSDQEFASAVERMVETPEGQAANREGRFGVVGFSFCSPSCASLCDVADLQDDEIEKLKADQEKELRKERKALKARTHCVTHAHTFINMHPIHDRLEAAQQKAGPGDSGGSPESSRR